MRYVRVKDENIIDLEAVNHSVRHSKLRKIEEGYIRVECKADTIEDLVLFRKDLAIYRVGKRNIIHCDIVKKSNFERIFKKKNIELYAKRDRAYVLLAQKVDGEWEVA